jgi:predicted branched-subunit amino acid permease
MANTDFFKGMKDGVVMALSAAPFGALFGAVAIDNGLTVSEAVLMSASVYAGASQLVGIELFGHDVPAWLIILSVFAVNFRHILYSAAVATYVAHFTPLQKFFTFYLLTDPQFAETVKRGESGRVVTPSWYLGFGFCIYATWVSLTFIGAHFGKMMGDPKALALDVVLPVYFLGMVMGFRKRGGFLPVVLAAVIGSVAAAHFVGSPWHVSLGALAGIVVAALLPPALAAEINDTPTAAEEA